MGSTRLPGKVMRPILGIPMLAWVVQRAGRAERADAVRLATTTHAQDDPVVDFATQLGCAVVRGPEHDVLSRYVLAAHDAGDGVLVRVTSDCPFIDPDLIDLVVDALDGADYASNTLEPRTFPRGLDVEVFTKEALALADSQDRDPASREHVTPYIYRHPGEFRLVRVANDEDVSRHRWTVDTTADLELVRRIAATLGSTDFGWRQALAVIEAHPEWTRLNAGVVQKQVP